MFEHLLVPDKPRGGVKKPNDIFGDNLSDDERQQGGATPAKAMVTKMTESRVRPTASLATDRRTIRFS